MTLLGINEVTEIINQFLEPFECTAELSTDFEYFYLDNVIGYTFFNIQQDSKDFSASVERLHPNLNCDIFLWSLLHELGHCETMDDLTDEEYAESKLIKDQIGKSEMDKLAYYDCPDEKYATEWAVEYANTHVNELRNFWNRLQPAILNVYKLNSVEE